MKKIAGFCSVVALSIAYFALISGNIYANKASEVGFIKVSRGDVSLERTGKTEKITKNMK